MKLFLICSLLFIAACGKAESSPTADATTPPPPPATVAPTQHTYTLSLKQIGGACSSNFLISDVLMNEVDGTVTTYPSQMVTATCVATLIQYTGASYQHFQVTRLSGNGSFTIALTKDGALIGYNLTASSVGIAYTVQGN